jgi:outer membrane immunogenic protein
MRRIISTGIGLLALAGIMMQPAAAADLPTKATLYKAPPVVRVWSWTGFYAGLNVGYSFGRSRTTESFSDGGTGALLSTIDNSFNMNGVIGGGQVGYNWQFDTWVVGIEADFQGSGQKGSGSVVCLGAICSAPCPGPLCYERKSKVIGGGPVTGDLAEKLSWFGTVRGRLGVTVTPWVLAYVTGGLAYGEVKSDLSVAGINCEDAVSALFSSSTTKAGWTIGGGLEGRIVGNWTAKVEYLYIDLGTVTSGAFVTPIVAPSRGFLTTSISSHVTDNIVRVGVNYKFDSVVVARY